MSKRFFCAALFVCSIALAADAPTTSPVALTAAQDRQRLMDLLHITEIPKHPDNNDLTIANKPFTLPDPLKLKNGQPVTTSEQWWTQRRPEIMEDFQREIYGRTPKQIPAVKWEVTNTTINATVITKTLVGHVDNSADPQIAVNIQVSLSTPVNAAGPVPVMMQLIGGGLAGARGRAPATRPVAIAAPPGPTWQQQCLAKGWGYATLNTGSVQADNGAGLTAGIIGLTNKGQPRAVDDWGVLSAWAWGASRALDYFESDSAVDAKRVGIEGHSRWGKATLVAMAFDPRFAIAYVSSSGEGGAKIHRHDYGESLEAVCGAGEYHWMAGNFLKYAGHWDDLPIDSHELIALCAPRPVLITGGTYADRHADAVGMFMAASAAGPVYRLLGKKDLGTTEMPKPDAGLIDGDIAFRQHEGGHTDALDWPTFITFASKYFDAPASGH